MNAMGSTDWLMTRFPGLSWLKKNTCNWVVVHPLFTANNDGPLVTPSVWVTAKFTKDAL